MSKIGRNDPCPCRSGKKYKLCCGSSAAAESRPRIISNVSSVGRISETTNAQSNVQMEINYLEKALPGQRFSITFVPQFASLGRGKVPDKPSGSPGEYRATFVLHRPGYPLETSQDASAAELLDGDSYLKLKESAKLRLEVHVPGLSSSPLHATTAQNSRGFVAKIETGPFKAQDFADARIIAFRMFAPLLSLWSIECNIPMSIYRTDVIEQATSSRCMDVVAPFPDVTVPPPIGPVGLKFRGYASLYRECLNCNTPAYTFLCLYRILEGLVLAAAKN
jgi:hypothetical protein